MGGHEFCRTKGVTREGRQTKDERRFLPLRRCLKVSRKSSNEEIFRLLENKSEKGTEKVAGLLKTPR